MLPGSRSLLLCARRASLTRCRRSAFTFSPKNFRDPNLPSGLRVIDVPAAKATDETLSEVGACLIHEPDERTVADLVRRGWFESEEDAEALLTRKKSRKERFPYETAKPAADWLGSESVDLTSVFAGMQEASMNRWTGWNCRKPEWSILLVLFTLSTLPSHGAVPP